MGKSMSDNRINKNQPVGDELHEECGVFGMYDFDGGDVASTIYYGLFALQHRGQESCGIAVSETNGPKGKVTSYKGMGLVNEVFTEENLEPCTGISAWGMCAIRQPVRRPEKTHSRWCSIMSREPWLSRTTVT